MNILIIGNGGRESAIIHKLLESPRELNIHCAAGIDALADKIINVKISVTDIDKLLEYAKTNKIDLTIVGPEAPLVLGVVDRFKEENLKIVGPTKAAAQLESSKAFSKDIMKKNNIPTASYEVFSSYDKALAYIRSTENFPIVIKASGLAAGKGVVIPENLKEAETELAEMMLDKKFGDSANEVVIESFLRGEEASIFAICDGKNFVTLSAAQDHKRIGEGDTGKNTGGMGAYAPAPIVDEQVLKNTSEQIIKPLLAAMNKEGIPFTGILFVGLMIENKEPSVVEFNVRFGDPETQVVLPLLKSDLLDLLMASCLGNLDKFNVELSIEEASITVVIASAGYPDAYEKGLEISGIKDVDNSITVHHAGTKLENSKLLTNGGRVLNLVSTENSLKVAADKIYSEIDKIQFNNKYYRRDIAHRVL